MARKITVKVTGSPQESSINASTVGELRDRYHAGTNNAAVNGNPASDDHGLNDGDFVSFAPAVKGN